MKKTILFATALIAAVASCNKPEVDAPVTEEKVWVEFTTGAMTKVTREDVEDDPNIKHKFVWEENDAITVNGETFITSEAGDKVTFGAEVEASFLNETKFDAIYPATAGESFEAITVPSVYDEVPESGFYGIVAVASSENQSFQFKHATAIVRFQVPAAVETVTISADQPLAGIISVEMKETAEVTVDYGVNTVALTGDFETGKDYYVPVIAGEKSNLTVKFDGNLSKTWTTVTLNQGRVANMGVVHPKESEIGLVGSFQGWDVANPVKMLEYGDGWAVAKNVELYKGDEFKFVTGTSWDNPNYGAKDAVLAASVGEDYKLVKGGQNIKATKNGKFDLYFNQTTLAFKYTCVEEYTDLKVTITIDNKANWSPLNITLKNGDTVIANNVSVTDNKYQISGEYIGSTLTCQFSNGTKTSEVMSVAITKTGATVTLEETIIKLKVQLNTANSKQWWGNTMKIHVWNTGTSFDTTWPGNTMTSEGNYTWYIIVPSELVGKTINYKVHNGNSWESSNSTVTISAKGNTVTGTSIGIN